MRLPLPLLLLLSITFWDVSHCYHSPGTVPEEYEVPRNPYQSDSWTGYQFYYEKEPKKLAKPKTSGKLPAFQSIYTSDRESPEDPDQTTVVPTTVIPTTTVPLPKVEVSPSQSTKGTTTTTKPVTISHPSPIAPTGFDALGPTVLEDTVATVTQAKIAARPTVTQAPGTVPKIPVPTVTQDDGYSNPGPTVTSGTVPTVTQETIGYGPTVTQDDIYSNRGTVPTVTHPIVPSAPTVPQDDTYSNPSTVPPGPTVSSPRGNAPGTVPTVTTPTVTQYEVYSNAGTVPTVTLPTVPSKPTVPRPTVPTVPQNGSDEYGPTVTQSTVPQDGSYSNPSGSTVPSEPTVTRGPAGPTVTQQDNYSSPSGSTVPQSGSYSNPDDSAPGTVPENRGPTVTRDGSDGYVPTVTQSTVPAETTVPQDGPTVPSGSTVTRPTVIQEDITVGKLDGYGPTVTEGISYSNPNGPTVSRPTVPSGPTVPQDAIYSNPDTVPRNGNAPGVVPTVPSGPTVTQDDIYSNPDTVPTVTRPTVPSGPTVTQDNNYSNPDGPTVPQQDLTVPELDGLYESTVTGDLTYRNPAGPTVPQDTIYSNPALHAAPTTTHSELRAQISEIDRIAEEFENAAREPVETNDLKLTSDSGKKYGRKSTKKNQKCCSCCDAPRAPREPNLPVTKLDSPAIQQSVPLQNTIAGEAYVPQPEVAPPAPMVQPLVHPTYPTQPVTHYQQPFQQYQPQYQYPQSPIPIGGGCGCPAPPQNCCAPPAPCCLPTIPCCPSLPCCPQPRLCCQAAPPPTCCQLSFQLPTIPICGRACPTCPCRRRVHAARRLKRSNLNCQQCSAAAEPWRQPFSPSPSCTTCGPAHRQRVKRMGCLPCLASRRVKRMGCLPCLGGRKKRSAQNGNCTSCTSLGQLFTRYKRSLFGCQPCAPAPQNCSCGGRKKRSIISSPPMVHQDEQCDATCCDTSQCTKKNR